MARPQKYTIDYFPHLCKQGKTMYIIESRYGNDGYAFWFKLLEILATTRGHYYEANDPIQLEFLGAKTRLSVEKTQLLLDLLAGLDAIDKDLWVNHKLIWCQNLVNNVSDVYENRKGLLPDKPYYDGDKLHQNIDIHHDNPLIPIDNTQSKVKEIKLNKTKIKDPTNFIEINNNAISQKKVVIDTVSDDGISFKIKDTMGSEIRKVFVGLRIRRGYNTPGNNAEAKSIKNMLKRGYTVEQILHAWDNMKSEAFWNKQELFMMSVEKQIGAILKSELNVTVKHQEGVKVI